MNWRDKALDILKESLTPIPHELSELDGRAIYLRKRIDLPNTSVLLATIKVAVCLRME